MGDTYLSHFFARIFFYIIAIKKSNTHTQTFRDGFIRYEIDFAFFFSVKSERHIVIHGGRILLFQVQLTSFNVNERDKKKEKKNSSVKTTQKSFGVLSKHIVEVRWGRIHNLTASAIFFRRITPSIPFLMKIHRSRQTTNLLSSYFKFWTPSLKTSKFRGSQSTFTSK